MGNDYLQWRYRVETKRIIWLIGLIFASIFVIQYFEVPYRDRMLSLLSSGKSYFNSSNGNGIDAKDIEYKSENDVVSTNLNHTIEEEPINRSIGIAPEKAIDKNEDDTIGISPSISFGKNSSNSISPENSRIVDSPTSPNISSRPVISPSQSIGISPSIRFGKNSSNSISPENSRIVDRRTSPNISSRPMISPSQSIGISPSISFGKGISNSISPENSRIVHSRTSPNISSRPVFSPSQSIGISPSISFGKNISNSISPENSRIVDSRTSPNISSRPVISPSRSVSPIINTDINDEKSKKSNITSPPPKEIPAVVSISEMNDMLIHSRVSSFSKSPLWPSNADHELLEARIQIENAPIIRDHPGLYGPIYRNLSSFVRSYEIMEEKLKVYIYKDGKNPVFHKPRLKGIYASEGWFMKLLEANKQFVTTDPLQAHLFYFPFSSQLLAEYVYVRDSHSFREINEYLKNYLDMIKGRYSFWNRTEGTDHFLVACHDWAPIETRRLMANCIRALCNSDVKEGFKFGNDVSLPETYVHLSQNPLAKIGGRPPSDRKVLAFFAGKMHGYVRPILLKYWENKDPDMKIFGTLRKDSYDWHMDNSKYCICAKGYEVNSPRVVEAIVHGCVPVILSDNFVPPFFDVLNWESFAVFVLEKDIPNLKKILMSISGRRYVVMQQRVKRVRQHFLWHSTPLKYDVFHMVLHSVWYNRVLRVSPM